MKQQARAELIQRLSSNSGLAGELATYQVLTGDWRNLFRDLEAINKVTREDVQRVATTYFGERNRTVAYLIPETGGGDEAPQPQEGKQ